MTEDERYVGADVLCAQYLDDLGMTEDALDYQQRRGLRAELVRERALIRGAGKRKNLYKPSLAREVILDWLHRQTEERYARGTPA